MSYAMHLINMHLTLLSNMCIFHWTSFLEIICIFCVFLKDGVILGADTRATEGPIVADKNCEKIHKLASNIFCCGAGTAADTENVTGTISILLLNID